MGSEGHPGSNHISKNSMNAQNSSQHGLFTNFNPPIEFEFNESVIQWNSKFTKQLLLGGVKGLSGVVLFSTLPIVGKIKFLYQRSAKKILGTYSQNERFSSPRAGASNVCKKDRCLTPPLNALTTRVRCFKEVLSIGCEDISNCCGTSQNNRNQW